MKRIIAGIVIILTLVSFAACQPTPEKSAVQSKVTGELGKALDAEPTAAVIDAEKHVSEEFSATDKKVTIKLDADVKYPEGMSGIEVYEVVPDTISTEFIEKAIAYCMGKSEIYEPPTEYSKEELDKLIKDLEAHLTDEWLNDYYQGDQDTIEEVRKMFEERRQEYLKAYKTAPDKLERKPAKVEYKPHKYYMSKSEYNLFEKDYDEPGDAQGQGMVKHLRSDTPTEFMCVSYPDDKNVCALYAYEITLNDYYPFYTLEHGIEFSKGETFKRKFDRTDVLWGNQDEQNVVDATVGSDFAEKEAQKLADALGLSDNLSLVSCKYMSAVAKKEAYGLAIPQGYWVVEFRRNSGQLICYDTWYMTETATMYSRSSYRDEVLRVRVTDDGIVNWTYQYPMKQTKTLNEGVGILSFEDTITRFREQSSVTYDSFMFTHETEPEVMVDVYSDTTEVKFTGMELRAIRIKEKNTSDRYMIVPCWVFTGMRYDYNKSGEEIYKENKTLILNALDGTVIGAADCY